MDEESRQKEQFDFDGFWKDLIERFWRELLKSVLPTLYAVADLTKEPEFLDKELRDALHIQDDRSSPRFVDMLLKIPLKGGGEEQRDGGSFRGGRARNVNLLSVQLP